MTKQIYYLQSCDEWKQTSSMRLLFIGTSKQKLKMRISKEIEDGNMEYKPKSSERIYNNKTHIYEEKENTPKQQAKLFRKDFDNMLPYFVDAELKYGTFDVVEDNSDI